MLRQEGYAGQSSQAIACEDWCPEEDSNLHDRETAST